MPDISKFRDGSAVEDRWSGRAVVYVEGADDERVFRRLMGGAHRAIEFKVPEQEEKEAGSGCMAVVTRVRQDRKANRRTFGLVDGETAANLGCVDHLLDTTGEFFTAPAEANADGVLFLAVHELENILLLHGDFCEHVSHDVRFGRMDEVDAAKVYAELTKLAKRYLAASVLKYASRLIANNGGALPKMGYGPFLDPTLSVLRIVLKIRQQMNALGADWPALRNEALRISLRLRRRNDVQTSNGGSRERIAIRLADGKGLWVGMMHIYNRHAQWEGHLTKAVGKSAYGDAFRETILDFTKAA